MFPLTSGSPSFLIKKEEDADKCWTSSQRIEFIALFLTVKHLLPLTVGTWRGVCRTVEGKKIVSGYFLLCCITDKKWCRGAVGRQKWWKSIPWSLQAVDLYKMRARLLLFLYFLFLKQKSLFLIVSCVTPTGSHASHIQATGKNMKKM